VTDESTAGSEISLELIAGRNANGEWVVENIPVLTQPQANSYLLLKSPMFVRGIAKSDCIQSLDKPKGAFKVLRHGGNLCIRVFGRNDLTEIEQGLSSAIEKLGGELDISESRALVYSIHVSCGFSAIEKILNDQSQDREDVVWYYGNVYDPNSGEPLNWWQGILSAD
jgi:Domain of unknown function (DUF4265)